MFSVRSSPAVAREQTRRRRLATRLAPLAIITVAVTALLPTLEASAAQAPIPLGTATSFAVLAGSAITNTGPTTIFGDSGSSPTPTETDWAQVTQTGTNHTTNDAGVQQAKVDLTTAYGLAAGAGPGTAEPMELGGLTLTPGVYTSPAGGFQITGTLTLNTLGNPAAVFIFQSSSGLTTLVGSNVVELNGGLACNVFWQVASSATLGVSSHLIGTVMAQTAITATTGATIVGRLLAETAAVTLDTNTITNQGCPSVFVPPAPTTTTKAPTTTTKAPTTTTKAPTATTKAPTATTKAPTATTVAPAKGAVLAPGAATPTPGTPTPGTPVPGTPTPTPGTPVPGTPIPGTPGTPTPPLPFTGYSVGGPLFVGILTVAFGVSLLGLSGRRHRRHSA